MSPAFVIVFALFVLALAVMAVMAVRWGVRRDRAANRQAAARREKEEGASPPPPRIGPAGSTARGPGRNASHHGDRPRLRDR